MSPRKPLPKSATTTFAKSTPETSYLPRSASSLFTDLARRAPTTSSILTAPIRAATSIASTLNKTAHRITKSGKAVHDNYFKKGPMTKPSRISQIFEAARLYEEIDEWFEVDGQRVKKECEDETKKVARDRPYEEGAGEDVMDLDVSKGMRLDEDRENQEDYRRRREQVHHAVNPQYRKSVNRKMKHWDDPSDSEDGEIIEIT